MLTRDPRSDPRPGDVVQNGETWTRTVTGRSPQTVTFDAAYSGGEYRGCFVSLYSWKHVVQTWEVLHVANES